MNFKSLIHKILRSTILFKKTYFLVPLLFLFIINGCEQVKTPEINDLAQVGITYGGRQIDVGYFGQQTKDGGFIITGCIDCESYSDLIIMKINELGDTLWTKTYGGYQDDMGAHGIQTSDAGYIVTGQTSSYGNGVNDLWLIKTDASGDTLWTRLYGGSSLDEGSFVQQTSDNGYILTGINFSQVLPDYGDVWLVKTDSAGIKLWEKTFGGLGLDWGRTVQQTSDGGYALTGWRENVLNGEPDSQAWLILTDSEGEAFSGD
ncbi:MAG TPA: hypothetical protein QGI69_00185 [Candidatus Marinimicrobia bacterium]|nr:hypothetical protein [Candidatus Neomarinimicrobiota bacterium]